MTPLPFHRSLQGSSRELTAYTQRFGEWSYKSHLTTSRTFLIPCLIQTRITHPVPRIDSHRGWSNLESITKLHLNSLSYGYRMDIHTTLTTSNQVGIQCSSSFLSRRIAHVTHIHDLLYISFLHIYLTAPDCFAASVRRVQQAFTNGL